MAFFASRHRENLVRALRRDVRLLLPADPGPARLLECVLLFNPRARLASAGSIYVDNEYEIYLTRGAVIEPDVAAEAGVPAGMGVAFFVSSSARAQPFSWSDSQNVRRETHDISVRLVTGLALRLGGVAWPAASVLREALDVRVYTAGAVSAEQAHEVIGTHVPGLQPYQDPTFGPCGVSAWVTSDRKMVARLFPPGTASLLRPHSPRSVGDLWYRTNELNAFQLRLSTPQDQSPTAADDADPGLARRLGAGALDLASVSSGVGVDQLGFRLQSPEDLVFRRPSVTTAPH